MLPKLVGIFVVVLEGIGEGIKLPADAVVVMVGRILNLPRRSSVEEGIPVSLIVGWEEAVDIPEMGTVVGK